MTGFKAKPADPSKPFYRLENEAAPYNNGSNIIFNTWLGSCGVGWLQNFASCAGNFSTWQEKAAWVSALYMHLYQPAHVLYSLSDIQLSNTGHLVLMELGARQIDSFPNLTHGPGMMHVFRVNIRNAVGRYCNRYGEPYPKPPKDDSEVEPEQTTPIGDWMYLPIRK